MFYYDNMSLEETASSEETALLFVISNVDSIQEDDILEYFRDLKVKDVYLPRNNNNENHNNDVYVEFHTKKDFTIASELIEIKRLNGRRLRMKEAEYDPRLKSLKHDEINYLCETSLASTCDNSNMINPQVPVPLPRTRLSDTNNAEPDTPELFVVRKSSSESSLSRYQENVELDNEMEELSLYFESEFEVIGDDNSAAASCSSHIQSENTEADFLEANNSCTDVTIVKEVENEANTKPKDEILKALLVERKENCELYKMLMGIDQEESNDVSLQDLDINHKRASTLVLEQFTENTEYLFLKKDILAENGAALIMEIEAMYETIKKQISKQQEAKECELCPEMHHVILNVIECYKMQMLEISETDELCDIEQRHASAFTQALDSFELLAESMEDKHQVAHTKLLNELKKEYDQLKQEESKIYLDEERKKLETVFQVKLRENERNFEIWPQLMKDIMRIFDELTFDMCDSKVPAQREQLGKAMLEDCEDMELKIAECERNAALEQYCSHMDVCFASASTDDNLPHQHLQFLTTVVNSYKLKTKGLPQNLVDSHCSILKKDISKKLGFYKRETVKNDVLLQQKLENDQLSEATAASRNVYAIGTAQFESEPLQNLNLETYEERHVLAMSSALDTFDMLTEHLPTDVSQRQRKSLISTFDVSYNNYTKLRINMLLTEQMKIAQEAFSERMRCAVRDSDACPTLQAQAKTDILANFDAATQNINSGEVAVHRAKLEESFVFCLDLVQTAWKSAGAVGTCCVCLERRTSVVFQPCLHLVSCDECAAQLTTCALCQAPIENKLHVFQQ